MEKPKITRGKHKRRTDPVFLEDEEQKKAGLFKANTMIMNQ